MRPEEEEEYLCKHDKYELVYTNSGWYCIGCGQYLKNKPIKI